MPAREPEPSRQPTSPRPRAIDRSLARLAEAWDGLLRVVSFCRLYSSHLCWLSLCQRCPSGSHARCIDGCCRCSSA